MAAVKLSSLKKLSKEDLVALAEKVGVKNAASIPWAQLLTILIQTILAALGGIVPTPTPPKAEAAGPVAECCDEPCCALTVLACALKTAHTAALHAHAECCKDECDDTCDDGDKS